MVATVSATIKSAPCTWLWIISLLGCLLVQNSASGDGVLAQPKVSDVAYIRDTYFSSVYEMVNNSMTANVAPNTTLRGKLSCCLFSIHFASEWYEAMVCCSIRHQNDATACAQHVTLCLTLCTDAIPDNIQLTTRTCIWSWSVCVRIDCLH